VLAGTPEDRLVALGLTGTALVLLALAIGFAEPALASSGIVLASCVGMAVLHWFGGWRPLYGTVIGVDYAIDPLGGALAVLAGLLALALAALVYSRRFFGETGGRYPGLVLVFTAASIDFAWTGDLSTCSWPSSWWP
jgi:multicomponent Na+:H+ antiporter subunit D